MSKKQKQKKREDRIREALQGFDFNMVYEAMLAKGWKWADHGRTPTPQELRYAAKVLLRAAQKTPEKNTWILDGGFLVVKLGKQLSLFFVYEWGAK